MSKSLTRVTRALADAGVAVQINEMPDTTRTAPEAAAAAGVVLDQIVKSILFQGASGRLYLFLTAGGNQVDAARAASLSGEALHRADAATVRDVTGFAIGGVAPVGHLTPLPVWLDPRLLEFAKVWAAAGTPRHIFAIAPHDLHRITGATVSPLRPDGVDRLDQVPPVAKGVAPDGDDTIRLVARRLFKPDAGSAHPGMVAGKVVGLQEKPDPSTRLIADGSDLLRALGLGQHQSDAATGRLDRDPALAPLIDVIDQTEPHDVAEKCNRRVIVRHDQGYGCQAGLHSPKARLSLRASGRLILATCSAIGSTDSGCSSARWSAGSPIGTHCPPL